MTCFSRLTFGVLLLAGTVTLGCSGSSNNSNPGTGGGGGSGPDPSFMAVTPCSTEASYASGSAISFPATATDFNYSPKCLKVSAGATVTFNGEFAGHPLQPSALRGTLTGNPITATNTGSTAPFTFPTAGFYAFFCAFHGFDDGQFMDGVIWVK